VGSFFFEKFKTPSDSTEPVFVTKHAF